MTLFNGVTVQQTQSFTAHTIKIEGPDTYTWLVSFERHFWTRSDRPAWRTWLTRHGFDPARIPIGAWLTTHEPAHRIKISEYHHPDGPTRPAWAQLEAPHLPLPGPGTTPLPPTATTLADEPPNPDTDNDADIEDGAGSPVDGLGRG